jgi:hypothetical protein
MTLRRALIGIVAVAALVGLAFALGIVGGDGGRASFISKGDSICRDGQGSFQSILSQPVSSAPGAAVQTSKLVAVSEGELSDLRKLDVPSDLRTDFDSYMKARAAGVAVLRKRGQAAAKGNINAYAAATKQLVDGQAQRADLARKVGFRVCSRPTSQKAGGG